MINHLNRKSIADTLFKILTVEASEIASDLQLDAEILLKYEIVERILDSFSAEDEEKAQNICDLLTEAINNRKFAILLIKNAKILKKIYNLITENINNEIVKELLRVQNKICEMVLREIRLKANKENENGNVESYDKAFNGDFDDMVPNKPVENFEIGDYHHVYQTYGENIEVLVNNYAGNTGNEASSQMHTTFDKTVKVLGTKRLLTFDFIKNIFEILSLSANYNIFSSTDVEKDSDVQQRLQKFLTSLQENNFFSATIDNFFIFEWNNAFQ